MHATQGIVQFRSLVLEASQAHSVKAMSYIGRTRIAKTAITCKNRPHQRAQPPGDTGHASHFLAPVHVIAVQ